MASARLFSWGPSQRSATLPAAHAGPTPTNGLPYDRAGSDIDTTNPDAARWFWEAIRDNILSKGFDAIWADETEPDLPPNGSYFFVGPGTRYFNIYPLLHTAAIYDGYRRDTRHRALILSRDAYLGAQRNGTMFWHLPGRERRVCPLPGRRPNLRLRKRREHDNPSPLGGFVAQAHSRRARPVDRFGSGHRGNGGKIACKQ